MRHNQIFPFDRFPELLTGLKTAYNNFEDTAMYFQQGIELQENSWYGITSKQKRFADVLWVCNNQVKRWENQITEYNHQGFFEQAFGIRIGTMEFSLLRNINPTQLDCPPSQYVSSVILVECNSRSKPGAVETKF